MRTSSNTEGARPLRIAREVVRQHAELVAFLWAQRDSWSAEDPPDAKVVAEIDERLDINLDGLRIAGAAAWSLLSEQYENFPEKGELFAFAWMALELDDGKRVEQAVEFARLAADDAKGLVGALASHKPATIGPYVRNWIGGQDALIRFLAISSCLAHNVNPGQTLARLIKDHDSKVRAAALRLAGQLRCFDLEREIQAALDHEDGPVRLWASWALVELGAGDLARQELARIATAGGTDAVVAMRALVKAGPENDVRIWMGGLMKSPSTAAMAVRGIGMLGDKSALGWLVERMKEPALALMAKASFLELFPEAREESKLFTGDPVELGKPFATFFADRTVTLSLADKVSEWAGMNVPATPETRPIAHR